MTIFKGVVLFDYDYLFMKTQKKRKILKVEPLPVITLGHSILRKVAKKVRKPTDHKIKELAEQMIATIKSFNGVGIAAPQVNHSLRIIVIASTPTPAYPSAPKMKPLVMINPRFVWKSKRVVKGWEGCGSLLGVRAEIMRSFEVEIAYQDLNGSECRINLTGLPARVAQHEVDHLNGIMFIDYVGTEDLVSDKYVTELFKKEVSRKR